MWRDQFIYSNFVSGAIRDPVLFTNYFNFVNYICQKIFLCSTTGAVLSQKYNSVRVLNLKKKSVREELSPLNTKVKCVSYKWVSHCDMKQRHNCCKNWVERMRKWKGNKNHRNMETSTRLRRAAFSEMGKRLADIKGSRPRCFLLTTISSLLTCTIKSS